MGEREREIEIERDIYRNRERYIYVNREIYLYINRERER